MHLQQGIFCLCTALVAAAGSLIMGVPVQAAEEKPAQIEKESVQSEALLTQTEELPAAPTAAELPGLPGQSETALISVERIEGIPEDFILGADVSSYMTQIESGVVYYDFEGNPLTEQGFFDLLAQGGMNCARIRVWNDPFDAEGHPYGGGNNDIDQAVKIGTLATGAGMKVLVDFHYSDFWADPGKQMEPKAWKGMSLEEKAEALYQFTYDSLARLLDAGVDVSMVQVGNETNAYLCGEKNWSAVCTLLSAGSKAVRSISEERGHEIQVVLHFSDPQTEGRYREYAKWLDQYQVDYDIFASSYYPIWHGTTENLTSVLVEIADRYQKKVMVAETQYAYTFSDGDGSGNTFSETNGNQKYDYAVSIQGQADEISDVIRSVVNVGEKGIGVFYWEPAWIPVAVYDGNEAVLSSNRQIWESTGSGWATSFAGSYDPEDAGRYYGGSAVDNMAWFDFGGHPTDVLNVYRYVRTGAESYREN